MSNLLLFVDPLSLPAPNPSPSRPGSALPLSPVQWTDMVPSQAELSSQYLGVGESHGPVAPGLVLHLDTLLRI